MDKVRCKLALVLLLGRRKVTALFCCFMIALCLGPPKRSNKQCSVNEINVLAELPTFVSWPFNQPWIELWLLVTGTFLFFIIHSFFNWLECKRYVLQWIFKLISSHMFVICSGVFFPRNTLLIGTLSWKYLISSNNQLFLCTRIWNKPVAKLWNFPFTNLGVWSIWSSFRKQ